MAVYLNQAKTKLLEARRGALRSGVAVKMAIKYFAVGNAEYYEPVATQGDLKSRIAIGSDTKKEILSITKIDDLTNRVVCRLTESECVGQDITELGLLDEDGEMVCIKTFSAKTKTSEREMDFYIDDTWEDD